MGRVQWGWTCVLAVTAAAVVAGQGKGKPAADSTLPATAVFRCTAGGGEQCAFPAGGTDTTVDRGRDDGRSYAYYSVLSGKQGLLTNKTGAFIESNGMFSVRVSPYDSRSLQVLLGTPLEYQAGAALPCETVGNCHPVSLNEQTLVLGDAQFRAKPVQYNAVTKEWEDRPNGLCGLILGTSSPSIVDYTFPDAGGNGHWGLNFNPRGPAKGSTMAEVERTGARQWYVRADNINHIAELIGYNHSGIRGKQGPSREGTYRIPLEVSVTIHASLTCP